jgi:hypothetical protein
MRHRLGSALALLFGVVLLVSGCTQAAGTSGTSSAGAGGAGATPSGGSSEPTAQTVVSGPVAVVASGALHTPALGSPERQSLMDAARAHLGAPASKKFVVYQLKSDGAWAIGELMLDGKTAFYAWRNEVAGGWKVFWSGPPGGPDAALAVDDRLPKAVIDATDWLGKPTNDAMVAAAVKLYLSGGAPKDKGATFGQATQDSKGRWWAVVFVKNDIDGAIVVIYRDKGTWKLRDMGTGIEPSDLPSDVKLTF